MNAFGGAFGGFGAPPPPPAPPVPPATFFPSLNDDMLALLRSGEHADVTLQLDCGDSVRAHRLVLLARRARAGAAARRRRRRRSRDGRRHAPARAHALC